MLEHYEKDFAAAYVRGYAKRKNPGLLPGRLLETSLAELMDEEAAAIIQVGSDAGLRMYHFKQREPLPRVRAVMGMLKGFQPENLLDVGSGRGVFLLPFLKEFPRGPVTLVDLLSHRVEMLQCLAEGGVENLTTIQQDICTWEMGTDAFDVVTWRCWSISRTCTAPSTPRCGWQNGMWWCPFRPGPMTIRSISIC